MLPAHPGITNAFGYYFNRSEPKLLFHDALNLCSYIPVVCQGAGVLRIIYASVYIPNQQEAFKTTEVLRGMLEFGGGSWWLSIPDITISISRHLTRINYPLHRVRDKH